MRDDVLSIIVLALLFIIKCRIDWAELKDELMDMRDAGGEEEDKI